MGRGWHLTYPVAGLVGEGRGRRGGTDRATGPWAVSSGSPHPDKAPLPQAALKSQDRELPPPPPPPPLPGHAALRRRALDVIAPVPLAGLAPPTPGQVSVRIHTAPAPACLLFLVPGPERFNSSPARLRVAVLRSPGRARLGILPLAAPASLWILAGNS